MIEACCKLGTLRGTNTNCVVSLHFQCQETETNPPTRKNLVKSNDSKKSFLTKLEQEVCGKQYRFFFVILLHENLI